MDTVSALVTLAVPLVPLPVVLKALAELKSLPRINSRAEYLFAYEFAERTGNADVAAHTEELGYRALVGGNGLTLNERKILLTLADSGQIVPKYLRANALLRIHPEWPHLRWARPRHENPWKRQSLIYGFNFAYFSLAMAGLLPIVLRYLAGPSSVISKIANDVPDWASTLLIILAAICLYQGVILSVASDLVKGAVLRDPSTVHQNADAGA